MPRVERWRMKKALAALLALSVPCVADAIMWAAMFLRPELSSRDSLTVPFVAIYLTSWASVVVGVIVVLVSEKSDSPAFWLIFFALIGLLDIYGFFWCIGRAVHL